MGEAEQKKRHFVLVHGACHGAWSWYKVKPRLESAGHRVTVLDLAASGVNMKSIHQVRTFRDYSEPLMKIMASIPPQEKVILVGHSLGGLSLALATDNYPEKVLVAVYVTAFMPDTIHPPSYVLEQCFTRVPAEAWLDTEFVDCTEGEQPFTTMFFGPKFFSSKLYNLCPAEDIALAMMLSRPGSVFLDDLSKSKAFSSEGYGSVPRVYVVCNEDQIITKERQLWMIENSKANEVKEIKGADHMPMFSKLQELCHCLMEIAGNYS